MPDYGEKKPKNVAEMRGDFNVTWECIVTLHTSKKKFLTRTSFRDFISSFLISRRFKVSKKLVQWARHLLRLLIISFSTFSPNIELSITLLKLKPKSNFSGILNWYHIHLRNCDLIVFLNSWNLSNELLFNFCCKFTEWIHGSGGRYWN